MNQTVQGTYVSRVEEIGISFAREAKKWGGRGPMVPALLVLGNQRMCMQVQPALILLISTEKRVQQKITKCLLNMPLQCPLSLEGFKKLLWICNYMPLKYPLKTLSIKRTFQWHVT